MTPAYLNRLHVYHSFAFHILHFNCVYTVFTLLPLGLCTYLSLASTDIPSHSSGPIVDIIISW